MGALESCALAAGCALAAVAEERSPTRWGAGLAAGAAALGAGSGISGRLAPASGSELRGDLAGPRARRLGGAQSSVRVRRRSRDARLLAQQVVADLLALLGVDSSRAWRGASIAERGVRAVVHGLLGDAEQRGDVGVALALAQQQRERSALVWWKLVQSAHGCV